MYKITVDQMPTQTHAEQARRKVEFKHANYHLLDVQVKRGSIAHAARGSARAKDGAGGGEAERVSKRKTTYIENRIALRSISHFAEINFVMLPIPSEFRFIRERAERRV